MSGYLEVETPNFMWLCSLTQAAKTQPQTLRQPPTLWAGGLALDASELSLFFSENRLKSDFQSNGHPDLECSISLA